MLREHVFPWWAAYLLHSPLRKLRVDPMELLRPYVREGAVVLDVGCAMGFFSRPMARLAGQAGKALTMPRQKPAGTMSEPGTAETVLPYPYRYSSMTDSFLISSMGAPPGL